MTFYEHSYLFQMSVENKTLTFLFKNVFQLSFRILTARIYAE